MGWLDWMFSKSFSPRQTKISDGPSMAGLWEQVGYLFPLTETVVPWPAGSLNASVREFLWFAPDGVVMFGRFGAEASVSFDEARRAFVCGGRIDAILTGTYRLEGNVLIEEWITGDAKSDIRRVELAELSAEQFAVKENVPQADVQLLVTYRRAPLKSPSHSPKRRPPPEQQIQWENATKTDQIEDYYVAYKATVKGAKWLVAVNDFPAEILYTLIVDGKVVKGINEWPKDWLRPETGATDLRSA